MIPENGLPAAMTLQISINNALRAHASTEKTMNIATDNGMTFGTAIELLKRGHRVARRGWNGKGMWLRYVDLHSDGEFSLREAPEARGTWLPFIVMKTVDNGLVPWLASQTDILANDWCEVES